MDKIKKYLYEEKGVTEVVAEILYEDLSKYSDIKEEFLMWLDKRTFDLPNPIEINGYTAKKTYDINPSFDAIGVYSFMVTLRDNPQKAQAYIERGFPIL